MPIVTMPDKTQVSFPDDMPAEQIKGLIASKYPDVVKPKSQGDVAAGLVGKASSGLTMGLGDELQAALVSGSKGTAQRVASTLGANIKPEPYGDIYNQELKSAREDLGAASEAYPKTSAGIEIASGVAPALMGYGALAKMGMTGGKTALQRRAKESVIGALGSGAYGFNTGEGGLDERLNNAKSSAIVGAIMSPALGAAAGALSKPVGAVANKVSEAFTGAPINANKATVLQSQLRKAIESGDAETRDALLKQINAGKVALPFEVPLSQGNISKDLQTQSLEELARKGVKGEAAQRIMGEFDQRQNQALKSNISALIKGDDVPANMVGDKIVNDVASRYAVAKGAKTAAYKKAKPLMEQAFVPTRSLVDFGSQLEETIKREFSPAMARKVRGALNANIVEGVGDNVPFSRIHDFNKQMGNLGAFGTPESAAGGRAKAMLREFLNGDVIQGDQTAVGAIRLADKLNVALKRTYQDKRASPIVKEIVSSVDNNTAIAPEKVFQSISTGNSKQNANNVKSLIDILGADHPTVAGLRDSILKDIRDNAVDASGFISPAKLAGNIDKFINTNRSVANQLISAEEMKMLTKLQKTARDIAYRAPGVVNNSNTANVLLRGLDSVARSFIGRKVPFLPSAVNSMMDASNATQVQNLVKPAVVESKPIFGGLGEAGLNIGRRLAQ